MELYAQATIFGIGCGVVIRLLMMRTDYRQYPTYLHGKIVHVSLGVIAAGLGAIFMPAILLKDYTAITFLTLAATQFRDVRTMERNTLLQIDSFELVPRGKTYIEGIAIAFESRNYLVIFASLVSTTVYIYGNWYLTIGAVAAMAALCRKLMSGHKLRDLCEIHAAPIKFIGAGLYVDNVYMMNIGHPDRQAEVLEFGLGFVVSPKTVNTRHSLANLGQRQAILHDTAVALGIYRDSGTPSLSPLIKRDLQGGRIGVFILPQIRNTQRAIEVIGAVPVLENAIKMPDPDTN